MWEMLLVWFVSSPFIAVAAGKFLASVESQEPDVF
jgi:hypothetical protein